MSYETDDLELIERGKELAGNWRHFESFHWFRRQYVEDPDNWFIVTTHHRDSTLLEQSNAEAIAKEIEELETENAIEHNASHWAVGWVAGWEIRVFEDDSKTKVTDAFAKYCELSDALENYPILDESDYSEKEYETTINNITHICYGKIKDDLPENWAHQVWEWFWYNNQQAIENSDDQGGYPSDEEMEEALKALEYLDE